MNRDIFFAHVRQSPFQGTLTPGQVGGMTVILDEWDKRKLSDVRWLAYMLATVYWECDRTMQPIREVGGSRARYAPYYGRGFVQLTWQANYAKASKLVGVDLVGNPDRALEPSISVVILYDGMLNGWFTNKKLADYINGSTCDYIGARRIINGTDRAAVIASYAEDFEHAIRAAVAGVPPIVVPVPVSQPTQAPTGANAPVVKPLPPATPVQKGVTSVGTVVILGGGLAASVFHSAPLLIIPALAILFVGYVGYRLWAGK